jgi:hypothetical protein
MIQEKIIINLLPIIPIGTTRRRMEWQRRDNTPDHQGFSTIYGIKLFFTEENHRQFIRDWKVSF